MRTKTSNNIYQLVMAVGLALLACDAVLAQDIQYNAAPGIDYSKYKTYKWVPIEASMHPDQIVEQQIMHSIDAQLASKGFTKTDSDEADLFVGYQVAVNQEKQLNAYGTGGAWRFGGGTGTVTSSTINVGTLGFDVYDRAAKQLIWRGAATKTLNPPKDPEKKQKNLDKAVEKLLKNFPPPKKTS